MGDRTQLGVKVDADLWKEFREDVEDRKGQVRGVLGDELENAIRQYLYTGADQSPTELMTEMNDRLQRVERRVGASESDGGTHTVLTGDSNTHTRDTLATTAERTDHLVTLAREENEEDVITVNRLREIIQEEFGFGDRTVEKYLDRVISELNAERPGTGRAIMWGQYLQNVKTQEREQRKREADETMQQMDDAEV